METQTLSTLELNHLIAQKASENEEFRLALINDARAAISKEFEVTFPQNTRIEVHVENVNELHLIIPAGNTDELSDDQLEDVAGGVGPAPGIGGGAVCAYGVRPPQGGGTGWFWPVKK